jgi:hypothetical protein
MRYRPAIVPRRRGIRKSNHRAHKEKKRVTAGRKTGVREHREKGERQPLSSQSEKRARGRKKRPDWENIETEGASLRVLMLASVCS